MNRPRTGSLFPIYKMQAVGFKSRMAVGILHCLTNGYILNVNLSVGASIFCPLSSTSCEVPFT